MISVVIKGAEQAGAGMRRLEAVLDGEFRNAALRAALIVSKEAKTVGFTKGGTGPGAPRARWPITYRRTGRTARSIRHGVQRMPGGKGWFGTVGSASSVMKFLEEGTSRMRPRKLLARSALRVRREINAEFEKAPAIARKKVFGS